MAEVGRACPRMTPQEVRALAAAFVAAWPERQRTECRWREPLVAFADARDPAFGLLKSAVGPTHALPIDLLPEARTVVVFFIPFDAAVPRSNCSGRLASATWAVAYLETNRLIAALGAHLRQAIEQLGHAVHATPATRNFDPERLVSDWSHRHVAWVAGLGSFGVNHMLITEQGCCGRLGSLVTSLPLEPTPREGRERCLHKSRGTCGACVERCVNGSLTVGSFDRRRCWQQCRENERLHRALGEADVCGKCLVGVPCSLVDPTRGRA